MKVASQEREVDHLDLLSTKPFLARIYPSRLFTNLFLSNSLRSQLRMKNKILCKKNVKQLNNTKQVNNAKQLTKTQLKVAN